MARSIQYWYDIMAAEKAGMPTLNVLEPAVDSSQTLLTDLKSTSKVARWRLLFWCIAACVVAFETVLDLAYLVMEELAAKSRYGSLPWWVEKAKEFQYGDSLVQVDLKYQYAVVDPTKQKINLAAASESQGIVTIKVASIVGGTRQPLAGPEATAALAYLNKIKPGGINLNMINDDPDDLKLFLTVNFNPLVMNGTGELINSPGTFPVDDAVNEYLNNLDFDGTIELMRLVDKVQSVHGVESAYVTDAQARYGANPYVSFSQRYIPNAGYASLAVGSLTTYVPYV